MKIPRINPALRAVGVISAVVVLVGGVTYAALQSSATLTNNTIAAADASLLLWDGDSFEPSAPGFTVEDLVPGEWTTENLFYFKNNGGADLDIKVAATSPTVDGVAAANVKVRFTSYAPGCVSNTVETTLDAIDTGDVALPCNALSEAAQGNSGVPATEGNYSVSYRIEPTDVTGSDVNISGFDMIFTGTAVASTP